MCTKVKVFTVGILLFLCREYRQQVDMLKKQLLESKAARTAKVNSKPTGMDVECSSDSLSD
jgi:zinc finger protein 830